ncbi:hypothetical protein BASA81_017472 [Batrachochytrium salamandrivorans]|nr:hypothetical protein BASA81_017472 [Batrachochytrium salamandrivorans]
MEKLVADLSARIKSLEKESIISRKKAPGVTSNSQPCHTGMCHFCQSSLQLRENPKSSSQTNSTDLAVTFEVSNQLELIFLDSTTHSQLQAIENCNSRNSTIRKSPHLVHPNGRVSLWPTPTFFHLGKASRKDMINTFGIADQTQESHLQDSCFGSRLQPCASRSLLDPCPSDHPTTFHVLEGHLINPENPNYQQQQQQQHQLQHQHQLRPEYQTNSSTPPAARQPDYMDVDLVRRGPLSSAERQHRMSQRLCLVCGQAGHIKATCPKSNSKFGTSKSVRAIQTSDNDDETSGNDQGCY